MPSIRLLNKLSLSEYTALAGNIPKFCPNATFTVASETFTAPEAVAFVNALLATTSAVATAKTDLETARMAEAAAMAANGAKVKAIRDTVELMFSDNSTTLAAFEITPKKPRTPLSTAARAVADAKAKATRLARGTTSKKQKATIDGNVTGVTITPITGPTAAPVTAPSTTVTPSTPVVPPTPAAPATPVAPPTPAVPPATLAPSTPVVPPTPAAPAAPAATAAPVTTGAIVLAGTAATAATTGAPHVGAVVPGTASS